MDNDMDIVVKEKTGTNKIHSIFLKEYNIYTQIFVYICSVLIIFISISIFTKSYVKYQQINLKEVKPISLQEFIDNNAIILENGEMKIKFSNLEFNQLLKERIQNTVFTSLKENKILECQYDSNTKQIYLNIKDKKGEIYSFICKSEITVKDNQLSIKLSDYRLGKLKSRVLGTYYKAILGIGKSLVLDVTDKNNIIYVKNVYLDSQPEIQIIYEYNYDQLIKRFNEYIKQVDNSKLELCKRDGKISEEIISTFSDKQITKESIEVFIKKLQKDSAVLEQVALLLNEQGIRELCSDFKKIYAKNLNIDKLVEKSENELDKSLSNYHFDFSRVLLNYLYSHRDYVIQGESILVDGIPLTLDRVLNESNLTKVYDIDIVSDSNSINAIYKLSDKNISKIILRKE